MLGSIRAFRNHVRKARARVSAQHGLRNKVRETLWIAAKAREKIARKLKALVARPTPQIAHTRETNLVVQRSIVSALLEPHNELRACAASTGGGAIAVALPSADRPTVWLRDAFSNLHEARIVEHHPIVSTAGGAVGSRLLVVPPCELTREFSRLDVLVQTAREQFVFESVSVASRPSTTVRSFEITNGCASFAGEVAEEAGSHVSLGVFVDDCLSASGTLAPEGRAFTGNLAFAHSHLDGRTHWIQLRELPTMVELASAYQILPLHVTPWNALQRYAGPPLDGTLSGRARHHLCSYRLWFERMRKRGSAGVPPLDRLHEELLLGFRKRAVYSELSFARPERPTVSVVIPVHNKFEVTYYCLCSLLFAFNDTSFEVIVVDDGSSDQTTAIEAVVGGIEVVKYGSARGFVHACNAGARRARGEFIVLLNNDTEVTPRWLDELVAVFRDFDGVGLAGSKLVYPDGRLQDAGGVIWGSGNPWNVGRGGNPADPKYDYLRRADYLSGAALMIPRRLWIRLGGFSEEFAPAYFEDTDLAMKVQAAGRHVVYVPTSTVYHFEGQSAGTNTDSGMKAFQEVNRPKFREKWARRYAKHGPEGKDLDREKDRGAAFRVLFIEHQYPCVDADAGSYAAFQEMRLLQALGAKVTFLPRNLAWMDRHTTALRRIGVECLYAPYVTDFLQYLRDHARDYDVVFVTRYKIAEQVLPIARACAPGTKLIFNLADLHFLRERREAAAGSPGYTRAGAERTRRDELAVIAGSDLTFSYSDVELQILAAEAPQGTRLARMPWVVDCRPRSASFADTRDILFLGGFAHPPNAAAARFFAKEVMPLVRKRLPRVKFKIIGSGSESALGDLASEHVRIIGRVPDISPYLDEARVFVAPLLAGAGLKGKVLDAISHGAACVLSPVAAEGTGLTDRLNCLVANSTEMWASCVARLYTEEPLWTRVGTGAYRFAEARYAFSSALRSLETALSDTGIVPQRGRALCYRYARPDNHGA